MQAIKESFLLDPEIVFLNHGSFGATPRPVIEAYQDWQLRLERQPVLFLGRELDGLMEEARTALGEYLHAGADDLVYIPNATHGVNLVARSLDLKPDDEILATDHEYGACAMTWEHLLGKMGARLCRHHVALSVTTHEEFVESFTFQTFEPRGMVEGHPNIKMANSIIDYVFRALGLEYMGRADLVQVPPKEVGELPEPPSGLAVDAGVQLGLDEDLPTTAPISHPSVAPASKSSPNGKGKGKREGNGHDVSGLLTVGKAPVDSGATQAASVQTALGELMGDAPPCDTCGHMTVRNGSCYRCLNCGNSLGCS